ncbi:MAG: hypothetical protein HDS88_02960 [Bacteroidales bacterium]|nr:hypothetical protein [Bacteroidales bacterium]
MKLLLFDRDICDDALLPESVTLLTDSALLHPGNPLFVPDFAPEFSIEIMPAITINRLGKTIPAKFAERYYASLTFIARVVPIIEGAPLRHGNPTVTNFDNAVILGQSIPLEDLPQQFTVRCNDTEIPVDLTRCQFNRAIELLSQNITLKIGDIIATSRLPLTIPATINTRVELTTQLQPTPLLKFRIK